MDETSSRAIDLSEAAARLSQAQVVESSLLAAAPTKLWESIASMAGVNAELMPAVRMTYPRQYERLDGEPIATGRRLFRSVLLLFGVLPIDLHAIALASLTPGHGFLESSSSLLNRRWIHERRLEPDSGGTRLTDRVYFECRVPGLGAALTPAVRAIFRHRHAQLGRRFGTGASGRSASPAVRRPLPGRSEG